MVKENYKPEKSGIFLYFTIHQNCRKRRAQSPRSGTVPCSLFRERTYIFISIVLKSLLNKYTAFHVDPSIRKLLSQ